MSVRQIDDRVASGLLVPEQRGVYRLAGAARTREQAILAACFALPATEQWRLTGAPACSGASGGLSPAGQRSSCPPRAARRCGESSYIAPIASTTSMSPAG